VDFGDQPLGPWGGLFLDFADALEALFGRHVDLIMPQSIRNPYFRQPVDASRQLSLFMKLEAKKLLFDVIKACSNVEEFTAGKAYDDYLASEMLGAAVERKFEAIYEALVWALRTEGLTRRKFIRDDVIPNCLTFFLDFRWTFII
jgi:hypothetical protein